MSRGRPSTRGMDEAIRIARARGCVMRIEYSPESVCDLLVRTATHVSFVKVRRTDRIVATVDEMERECSRTAGELRLFPRSPQIMLEIWIYSRSGTFRFFRAEESGLVETAGDGTPAPVPGGVLLLQRRERQQAKKSGGKKRPETGIPGEGPEKGASTMSPGIEVSVGENPVPDGGKP